MSTTTPNNPNRGCPTPDSADTSANKRVDKSVCVCRGERVCICEEGVSADSSQENPPHPEQYPGHSLGSHQSPARGGRRPTLTLVHSAEVSPMLLAIDKERASLAAWEIKTTALSWKCGQYLDKRTAANVEHISASVPDIQTSQSDVSYAWCIRSGQQSTTLAQTINLWVKCGICGRTSGGGLFLHSYELLQAFRLSH